MSNSV